MSDLLVALADLSDRPANRSALTWASWARSVGHDVSVLTGAPGDLAATAAAVGPVVDVSSVNDLKVVRFAGRIGLAPVGRVLKSRLVRSMVTDVGAVTGVVVAEPEALALLGWLRSGDRQVLTVVPESTLEPEIEERMAAAGSSIVAIAADAAPSTSSTAVDVGLMVRALGDPVRPDDPVAVAGLSGDQLDRFVDIARAIRRAEPTAMIGWVRDDAASGEDRWAWPLFGRGDLVDLAGVITAVSAAGTQPVRAVVEAGPIHPLVTTAARVSGRPVVAVEQIGDLLPFGTHEADEMADGYLAAHDVDHAGPRLLAALDGT